MVLQAVQHILDGKALRPSPRQKVGHEATQASLSLGFIRNNLALGNESADALLRGEGTSDFQFPIAPDHGVGINGEVHRHLANGGQLRPRLQGSRGHGTQNLVDNLPVDRDAGAGVQMKSEGRGSWGHDA